MKQKLEGKKETAPMEDKCRHGNPWQRARLASITAAALLYLEQIKMIGKFLKKEEHI